MVDVVINPLVAHQAVIDVFDYMKRHRVIGPRLEEKKRTGFYFVFGRYRFLSLGSSEGELETVEVLATLVGGEPERLATYRTFAREKFSRVCDHRHTKGHWTSRQSRDLENEKYAGAVLGTCYGCSVSGLPEDEDEIVSAAVLYRLGDLDWVSVDEHLLGNQAFDANDEEMRRIFNGGTR